MKRGYFCCLAFKFENPVTMLSSPSQVRTGESENQRGSKKTVTGARTQECSWNWEPVLVSEAASVTQALFLRSDRTGQHMFSDMAAMRFFTRVLTDDQIR